jgi:uncharacterized protein (TIGR03086 family)
MDQLTAHRRAQDVYAGVLARVTDDQLDNASPCAGWTAKDVIDHVVGGNQIVRTRGGLDTIDLPPDSAPNGRSAAHAASAASAHEVFAAPDGLTRTFELPFGAVPGTMFIGLRTIDLLVHAWDLAKATGQPTDLDPELAAECLATAKGLMAPGFRGEGRPFAEEQQCPPGATPADTLAAYLGRSVG